MLFALWCWWLRRRYSTAQLCSRLLWDHKGPAEYCNAHLTCSDVLYVRPLFSLNCSFFIVFKISQTCSLVKESALKVGPEMIIICTLFMTLLSETEGRFFITWKHKLTSKKSFVSLLSRQKCLRRTTKQLRNPERQKAHMYSVHTSIATSRLKKGSETELSSVVILCPPTHTPSLPLPGCRLPTLVQHFLCYYSQHFLSLSSSADQQEDWCVCVCLVDWVFFSLLGKFNFS